MLGIRTRGRSMVGADETPELWQPSNEAFSLFASIQFTAKSVIRVGDDWIRTDNLQR